MEEYLNSVLAINDQLVQKFSLKAQKAPKKLTKQVSKKTTKRSGYFYLHFSCFHLHTGLMPLNLCITKFKTLMVNPCRLLLLFASFCPVVFHRI